MAQHTPGPWSFYRLQGDDGVGYIRPDPEDGFEIAHHGDSGRAREENLGNASLIAAAPEMLAELRRCVADFTAKADRLGSLGLIDDADDLRIARRRAEDIIAKAEAA